MSPSVTSKEESSSCGMYTRPSSQSSRTSRMMLISCSATPSVSARATSSDPYTATHATPTAPATLAVTVQLAERRIPLLVEILQPALDERMQRRVGNRESGPRIRKRNEHRLIPCNSLLQGFVELLEPDALLRDGEVAVGDIVDAPREGIDRGDRAALLARQHHDPVREIARAPARQALNLRVGGVDAHLTAASARRIREGRGRCVNTSQCA